MDYEQLLTLSTDIGYCLLESGAEIYRVEESINRILQAYGLTTGEVFVIPSCVIVSLSTPEGQPITRVRRVGSHGTDIHCLQAYNDLCRRLCSQTPPFDQAQARILEIQSTRPAYSFPTQMAAYFLGTGAFTLFYNGTLPDALCGGLCGVSIGLCLSFMTRLGANLFFKTIAGGAVSALLAVLLVLAGLGQNIDSIIIGALMALVPGVIFTNAMRDIMAGDLVAGISRVAEALLIGAAIALGTGFVLSITRGLTGG